LYYITIHSTEPISSRWGAITINKSRRYDDLTVTPGYQYIPTKGRPQEPRRAAVSRAVKSYLYKTDSAVNRAHCQCTAVTLYLLISSPAS